MLTVTATVLRPARCSPARARTLRAHALGHRLAEGRRAVGQDDRELLAAEARHRVHRAHAVVQRLRRRPGAPGRRPAWPWVSLTFLKWSMSSISTRAGSPARATRSISRASASSNWRRLARPVSASRLDSSHRPSITACSQPAGPLARVSGRVTPDCCSNCSAASSCKRGGLRSAAGAWGRPNRGRHRLSGQSSSAPLAAYRREMTDC